MNLICSFIIAFSMYSRIPMPHITWTEERMKDTLGFFPAVGVVEGLFFVLSVRLCDHLGFQAITTAILMMIVPILINGGIHMDGFLDVVDALSSYGDRQEKQRIMKDPNSGAFAVIFGGLYLMVNLAVMMEIPKEHRVLTAAAAVFVISRALSGLSVILFPKAKRDGLASTFAARANKQRTAAVLVSWLVAGLGWIVCFEGWMIMTEVLLLSCVIYACYYRLCMHEFGGVSGDLAGFFLQMFELMILCLLMVITRLG